MKDQKQIWLVFTSVKTGVETRLPLRLLFQGKALLLLNKYRKNLDFFFRLKNNSLVNKELIRIGKLAQITQHFSFHSARHTNVSLLIYQGAQITTVQKLLGHRSIKTTQGYSNIFSDTIIKDLKRCCSHEKTTKWKMVSAIYNIIRCNFFCSQLKNPVNKTPPDRDFYPCTLWFISPLENEKSTGIKRLQI